jgi:hypothetical protein
VNHGQTWKGWERSGEKGLIISDNQAQTWLIITINDTSIGDLPLIITISDTCKNQPKRLDFDNTINLSSLIVSLGGHCHGNVARDVFLKLKQKSEAPQRKPRPYLPTRNFFVYYESMKRKLKIKPNMSVGVMEDYKLRDLRVSHTLGWSQGMISSLICWLDNQAMKSLIITDNQGFHQVSPRFSNSPDDSPDQALNRMKI